MRITVIASLILGLALCAKGETVKEDNESLLNCIADDDTLGCLTSRLARDIDQIEVQVTGRTSETPMSSVIEQAGNFVAELIDDVQHPEQPAETEQEEGRGKKIGKRKKKHLQKLLGLAMLFKAKISLLLQLISTHFQVKFFVIAVITLILNAARFWIDLKKSPSKVIYYEHAQHQHHYDHDDHDSGYWGRSSNDSPQDLAYSAYAPQSS
ncbi:uncharacterized protein LOC108627679 [Ceratina calcarata]|uniref:Uncharacterized protein LOC108627679 n=1 Tax=Ceratina calcarata TaxID=156304 RepID=A0AAJ7J5D0_9HYME|nr:uncharacterized protein LOC108627679 [Ceratina calcarata]